MDISRPDQIAVNALRGTPATRDGQRLALVAEDDEKVGLMLGEALRCIGFTSHVVFDGMQAMKDILEMRPDLIVLDLVLPRLHGQEIVSVIRYSQVLQQTPIVVISGWARHEDQEEVFRMGANDFIVKPFHPDQLIASVRSLFTASPQSEREPAARVVQE